MMIEVESKNIVIGVKRLLPLSKHRHGCVFHTVDTCMYLTVDPLDPWKIFESTPWDFTQDICEECFD